MLVDSIVQVLDEVILISKNSDVKLKLENNLIEPLKNYILKLLMPYIVQIFLAFFIIIVLLIYIIMILQRF
jgi:hypothetical protein